MKKRYYGIDKEKLEAKLKQLEKLSLQEGPIGIEFEIQMLAVQNVLDCLEPDEPEKTARQIASKQLHNPTEWDEPTEPPTDSHSCSGCDECKQPVNGTYTEPPKSTLKSHKAGEFPNDCGACKRETPKCEHSDKKVRLEYNDDPNIEFDAQFVCVECGKPRHPRDTPKETRLDHIRKENSMRNIWNNNDWRDIDYLIEQLDTAKEALERIRDLSWAADVGEEFRKVATKALDYLDE